MRPEAEGDRAPGVLACLAADAEAQVLSVTDGGELAQLAAGGEQVHRRVPEAERREPLELCAQVQREASRAREHGIDDRERPQLLLGQRGVGMRGERLRELVDVLTADREARCGAVPAEALQVRGARG